MGQWPNKTLHLTAAPLRVSGFNVAPAAAAGELVRSAREMRMRRFFAYHNTEKMGREWVLALQSIGQLHLRHAASQVALVPLATPRQLPFQILSHRAQ
jgi:hypothetical protein